MKTTPAKDNTSNFETSLNQLECLVEEMETGDISLDAALKAFEEGVKLTREAQQTIAKAEQTIQILVDQDGVPTDRKFHDEEDG